MRCVTSISCGNNNNIANIGKFRNIVSDRTLLVAEYPDASAKYLLTNSNKVTGKNHSIVFNKLIFEYGYYSYALFKCVKYFDTFPENLKNKVV